ncbi:MAG: ABC transporter ATP-binding protein [Muribaculaceae bacterium]|nr:ABC transporter ATP-binding protein [Muribaculaceae bacterium]
MDILTTENLAVGYHGRKRGADKTVLSELNLSLPEGSLTLLIGANGSGKSTLLRTISGAQPALGGSVCIAGKNVDEISLRERAKLLALVYTDRTGGGGLTVSELVGLGRQPYTGFIGRLSIDDRMVVNAAMEAVGIAHKAENFTATLSDGERQKAMIARALAQQTPLIILDEPTAFLDIASRLEIMQLLGRLVHDEHKTILLSTHDIASAIGVADRLWIVDATARTIIQGETATLLADGTMDKVFPNRPVIFNPALNDFTIAINTTAMHR